MQFNNKSTAGMPLEKLLAVIARTPFARLLGAEVVKYSEGEVELAIPIVKDVTQHHGFAHGAVVGFVADSACAWAAASVVGDVVTSEYKINLITPGVGSKLIGRGYAVKALSRQVICRADVFAENNGREVLVATALATVARISV